MRGIAKVVGVLFVLGGLWGLLDSGLGLDSVLLQGLLPVNIVLNLLHLVLGIWGYAASRSDETSGQYGRIAGVLFLLLGAAGFVTPNLFDLLPVGGANRFLHLVTGLLLLGMGVAAAARPRARHAHRG